MITLLLWLLATPALAQEPSDPTPVEADEAGTEPAAPAEPPLQPLGSEGLSIRGDSWITLLDLAGQAHDLEVSRTALARAIEATPSEVAQVSLQLQVDLLDEQLRERRGDIARLITGQDPWSMAGVNDERVTWESEMQELMAPMLSQLRQATERPRNMERLRGEIVNLEYRTELVKAAIRKSEHAVRKTLNPHARAELERVLATWLEVQGDIQNSLKIRTSELHAVQDERAGIAGVVRSLYNLLLRSRGQNLATAFVVFFLVLVLVRFVHWILVRTHIGSQRERVTVRVAELGLYASGLAAAMACSLGVLFVSGDWVLLTLAGLIFFGILWSARAGIPRFWNEIQLLLNIGPVREGERMIWAGLPWKVERLSVLSIISNPAFPDTHVRLPLRALEGLASRPPSPDEPWFPSEVGDWVLWGDRAAEVMSQGPEFIRLMRDRSEISVPATEFLAAGAENLSHGFRHRVMVTLDYRHQAQVTTEIPLALKGHIEASLKATGDWDLISTLAVAFDSAGSSSLDIEIEADFIGEAAPRWEDLEEIVQAAAVDACNEENWEIALPQLTLHQASIA